MRVLLWSSTYPPALGGVETVVHGLARSLTSRGARVFVVTQGERAEETVEAEPEATVCRLPFHQVLSSRVPDRVADLTRRVATLRRDFRPDVVHVHAVHPSEFFLLRTNAAAPCPIVFTMHGWTEMEAGVGSIRERLLRHSDRVTGVSEHVVERMVREVPECRERASVVYNGCHDPGPGSSPLPVAPPRILCAGRLVESKGFDLMLGALPRILERLPDTRLTIAGEGPERERLVAQSAKLDLDANVQFTGRLSQEELFARLSDSTVLVMPSRRGSEGLPMMALEAALLERPVVASRDGGLPEAVLDGHTGLLVESDDQRGLEASVLRILENPRLARALGRQGRQRTLAKFSWESQIDNYQRLYETLSGSLARQ